MTGMETSSNGIRTAGRLIVAATCLATFWPAYPQEREVFSGAALLYTVPSVTLVYPGGPGEDRERNRVSAERRAAYLTGRHETETRVVADVDVTDEDRKTHLLVLGWNNRLIRETGLITSTARGWEFQGIERGFDRDLLFSWVSPFDERHEFFFWSRIDPELDRYLVLPFFGSDWIVFDGYTIEQYGRFVRADLKWPPRRNPAVEIDNRTVRLANAPKRSSQHYTLYDRSFRLSAAEVEKILRARESAWAAAVAALGAPPPDVPRIELYVYENSEQKELRCDVHEARHHLPASAELHITKAIALDPNLHEDTHLIARQSFGPGYLTILVEGVAVWAEQQQGVDELPVYADMLTERMEIPGLDELLDEETMRVLIRGRAGFPLAGLFVAWLRSEAGPDVLRRVYGRYESDPELFARALELTADEVDKRFSDFVRAQAETGETEAAFREATARARHYGGLGDYEQAIPALERALELRPGDLFTLYSLAVARMKLDDLDAAEADLTRILEIHSADPDDRLALLAWYQLGELHAERGETGQAKIAYRRVLELPDYRGMHRRTQDALDEMSRN